MEPEPATILETPCPSPQDPEMASTPSESDLEIVSVTLHGLKLTNASDLPNLYGDKIPERVRCHVQLRVGPSSIPGAGRGMFVETEVVAGDRLFAIDNPIFLVVETGHEAKFMCDNCFATLISADGQCIQTVGGGLLNLSACAACKSVWYCKKACQREAWHHHHKLECGHLGAMQKDGAKLQNALGVPSIREFRALLRLILLRKHGKISDSDWVEIRALRTGKEWRLKDNYWASTSAIVAANLLKYDPDINLSVEKIVELYWVFHENNLEITQPWIKAGSGCYDTEIQASVGSGLCLEPFASMINHSCKRNARYFFEGKRMSFRATRKIKAGEEITTNYTIDRSDYEFRRAQLHAWWNIICQCHLCTNGDSGPTQPLRGRLRTLIQTRINDPSITVKALKKAIADMKADGWGYDIPPMWDLHRRLFRAYADQKDHPNVLKTAFAAYAVIAPLQPAAVYQEHANDMLGNIVQLIDPSYLKKCKLDGPTYFMFHTFYPMLLEKYVMEVKKLYSRTSRIAWQAEWYLQRQLEIYRVQREKEGVEACYVRMEQDEKQKKYFLSAMNTMLKWAGLPPTTMTKLFRF